MLCDALKTGVWVGTLACDVDVENGLGEEDLAGACVAAGEGEASSRLVVIGVIGAAVAIVDSIVIEEASSVERKPVFET